MIVENEIWITIALMAFTNAFSLLNIQFQIIFLKCSLKMESLGFYEASEAISNHQKQSKALKFFKETRGCTQAWDLFL